jgi:hypothetical protein
MPAIPQSCPKCNGSMEQGYVIDRNDPLVAVSQWTAGAPHYSFWRGTTRSPGGTLAIGTFRCSQCGFLESYARPEFSAQ